MIKKVFWKTHKRDRYALGKWLIDYKKQSYMLYCWAAECDEYLVAYSYVVCQEAAVYSSISGKYFMINNLNQTGKSILTFKDAINWIKKYARDH